MTDSEITLLLTAVGVLLAVGLTAAAVIGFIAGMLLMAVLRARDP